MHVIRVQQTVTMGQHDSSGFEVGGASGGISAALFGGPQQHQ
jgi:hypothetical protein